MEQQIKERIEKIRRGEVPEGYKWTKIGIVPNEWNIESLKSHLIEYRHLSNDIDKFDIYSSSRNGLILQSAYYNQRNSTQTNLGYKTVPHGYVTYRHMSDDDIFHFNINRQNQTILVSAEYPVFDTDEQLDTYFLIAYLNSMARFRYFCRGQKMGGTRTRLYFSVLGEFKLAFPPISEQQKIAEILAGQDQVIKLKEKLLDEKQKQKKYLMQQLLTGKQRLPGFSEEWKQVKLGDFFKTIKRRNIANCETLLTISAQYGLIKQELFFNKSVAGDDKSNYYLLRKGEFAYNKSYSNDYPNGAIKRLDLYSEGIVSPLYLCLQIENNQYSDYFVHYFESGALNRSFCSIVQEGARNHGILNVSSKDILDIQIIIPPLKEQTAIAEILSTADKEIELLKKDIEQEKLKKKSLMQLLLTGIVRVGA